VTLLRLSAGHAVAPILVFGIGNPSRGDDALGPMLIDRLAGEQVAGRLNGVDLLTDFQLQPEHALDLRGRARAIFVDAAAGGPEPFGWTAIAPVTDIAHSTHSTSPEGLLAIYRRICGPPPWCELVAIRGYAFELGSGLTAKAEANLAAACRVVLTRIASAGSGLACA